MTVIRLFYGVAQVEMFVARLLLQKLLPRKITIQAASKGAATELDRNLWSLPQATDFIPHCLADDPLAQGAPVVIAHADRQVEEQRDVLVNLTTRVPDGAMGYEDFVTVLADKVTAHSELEVALASLAERGHQLKITDMNACRNA